MSDPGAIIPPATEHTFCTGEERDLSSGARAAGEPSTGGLPRRVSLEERVTALEAGMREIREGLVYATLLASLLIDDEDEDEEL